MARRNTKEAIRDVALHLFSERGYDGVGVREIAKGVGIRESALYKHYSGKREIFDSVIESMGGLYEREMESFQLSESMASWLEGGRLQEGLVKTCVLMFRIYMEDEDGSRLRRMLTFEQVKDTEVGRDFRDKLIDGGLHYITDVFTEMIQNGYYQEVDPYVMAMQFYSPLYLLLTKYDRQPDKYGEALACLERHIKQFDAIYRRG